MSNVFFNNPFWTYWALTFAVFLIFAFSFVVAAMDIREEVAEALRKAQRRAKPKPRFDNPLADRTVAATLDPGANRALPPQLQWVYDQVAAISRRLGIEARILVYEDSKGHPLVHLTDGKRLVSYRLDRTLAEEARAGKEASLAEAQRRLEAFMRLEWLGDQTAMQRTTELAKEAKATPRAETKAAEPEGSPTPEPAAAQTSDAKAAERQRLIEEAKAKAAARRAQQGGSEPAGNSS